jgi:hypothetical protein
MNYKELQFELMITYKRYITYPYLNIKYGLLNLKKYFNIIWNDRWYDFDFFDDLLYFKLKDMEKNWGVNTHYVGDKFTKGRIQVLLKYFEKSREDACTKEEMKQQKYYNEKFHRLLARNKYRFWD